MVVFMTWHLKKMIAHELASPSVAVQDVYYSSVRARKKRLEHERSVGRNTRLRLVFLPTSWVEISSVLLSWLSTCWARNRDTRRLSMSVCSEREALAWTEDVTVFVGTGACRQPFWWSHVVYYHNGIIPNEHSGLIWLRSDVITYPCVYWVLKLNISFGLPEQPTIKLLFF